MIGGVDPMFGSSSPTQMETSGYLPAYLLGGPSSPSTKVVSTNIKINNNATTICQITPRLYNLPCDDIIISYKSLQG